MQRRSNVYPGTITFGNSVFVALERGGFGSVRGLVSRDGLNWTETTLLVPDQSMTFSLGNVTFAANRFFAAGSYLHYHFLPGGNHSPEVHSYLGSSFDGYTWSATINGPFLGAITYGRGALVAIGVGGLLVSTNGPWNNAVTNSPVPFISLFFEGDKFLAGADSGPQPATTNRVCLVYISTNAVDWTSHSISNCLRDVSFGEGTYAAVDDGTISTSQDGVVWTRKYLHPSARFTSIAYGAGTFVAVGERGAIVQSDPFAPILALRTAGTNLQLEVFAEPGNYELHSSPNLEAWHNAGPFTNQGSPTVLDLQPTGSQRFYRARRLP